MFHPVNTKISFPELETEIIRFWKDKGIFQKSLDNRTGAPQFTMYDGPPTANGKPGIHHVLSRVYKDLIPRYRTMKGNYVPRKAGWDTHGLPVELEIEKKLKFTSKADIENYGVAQFNKLCRESVFTYLKEWDSLTERIGFWLDLEHPYITLQNSYIESCWWAIKELWDKGLVYQGYKVTPHCPRCGTSLSSHEVALGYRDDTPDPSVFIKFKIAAHSLNKNSGIAAIIHKKPAFLLAWTTTPWTLPGNTALAVSADLEYSIVENEKECLILASARVLPVGFEGYTIAGTVQGSDLAGVEYEPLFNPHTFNVERRRFQKSYTAGSSTPAISFPVQTAPKDRELAYKVIATDFVSMEDGTGIVHVAPAFGEVDFKAGEENELDFVQNVDLDGKISGTYSFAGKFVKKADPLVIEDLSSRGLLYRSETIKHTYPFCWRCDSPLLYYAKRSWYIRTTAKKQELIDGNAAINWYPDHIKLGRFGNWLENNVDWAFSRERYWGTPLNVWHCTSPGCQSLECVGSIDELKSKPNVSGVSDDLDLHRPYVDEITFDCRQCGGQMKRQTEVIDCWFDSGAMPFAQWHYPFENKDIFNKSFPADYICEAVDQTRGWFYSLHALSILLKGEPCYKNVICLGLILDAQGEKMSKARGNVVDPWSVLNKSGADALRWYLFTSSPPGNVRRFSSDLVGEVLRSFILTLWNTYSFFIMYANIDNFDTKTVAKSELSDLDIWILSSLNQLIADVDSSLENYDPTTAGRKIESFVGDLSNWYVRRSRRRFWKSQNDTDKVAAYSTLYQCLVTLTKLLAPFMPFIAEDMYRNLVCSVDASAPESVHLTDFPVADMSLVNTELNTTTNLVMTVCSLGRAARSKAGVKVRQPLAEAVIKLRSKSEIENLQRLASQIVEELNVKSVKFVQAGNIESIDGYVSMSEGDCIVAIDTRVSGDLETEGMAREIVRRLQIMRKSAGFEIADHIAIYYDGDAVKSVMQAYSDYIKEETLAESITAGPSPDGVYSEKHKIAGSEVTFGVQRRTSK